ncbi:hypothetical protein [Streptomyces sp. NBC_00670]|uniref:hypothetical protein n=1 Tax=Streptomyces sp. NBC_00670 TaxID=2975804 RepID=UPI002E34E2F5|nr:hypothetical protein [Streptomyces sp. NBC_00670]
MPTPSHLLISWLSRSHPRPSEAAREMQCTGFALLAMGVRISAIRVPGALVHAAAQTEDHAEVAEYLLDHLDGAVALDPRHAVGPLYYALIHGHAGLTWQHERLAACLGDGVYLGLPAPHRVEPPGPHWIVPPRYDGDLCKPRAVAELVQLGHSRLEPAEATTSTGGAGS